jgi:hypothetical protein
MRCVVSSGCSGSSCMPMGGEVSRLYYLDDFKLIYTFTDSRFTPTKIVPPSVVDFEFTFAILGKPNTIFVASHRRDACPMNCIIDDVSGEVTILMKDHKLGPGQLQGEYHFRSFDPKGNPWDRYQSELFQVILTDNILDLRR